MDLIVASAFLGALISLFLERVFGSPLDRLIFRLRSRWLHSSTAPKTLTGIWKTSFSYKSSVSESVLEDEYLIVLKQGRSGVTGQSVNRSEGSNLTLQLEIENSIVTGIWRELTSDSGRAYHGTCQLMLSGTGNELKGRWMGFRRDDTIGDGPWAWVRVDTRTSRKAQRRYEQEYCDLAWHRPADT